MPILLNQTTMNLLLCLKIGLIITAQTKSHGFCLKLLPKPPTTFRKTLGLKFYPLITMFLSFFQYSNFWWNRLVVKSNMAKSDLYEKKSKKCGGCVGIGSKRSKMDINNIPDHSPLNFRTFSQKILFLSFFGVSRAQIPSKSLKKSIFDTKNVKKSIFEWGKHLKPIIWL